MADILIDNQAMPSTPAAGRSVIYVDSTTGKLSVIDSSGRVTGTLSRNDAIASQALGTGDTYVTNSGLLIPSCGMKALQVYRWRITLSKTAAGTAATIIQVRIGTTQSTSDTSRVTWTANTAQTAAIALGTLDIQFTVRNQAAAGVIAGGFGIACNSAGLGGGADGVSASFDNTALQGQYVGISINAGASSAWTTTSVSAELIG